MPNWCLRISAMCALLVTVFSSTYTYDITPKTDKDACLWCGRPEGPRETMHFQSAACYSQFVLHGYVASRMQVKRRGVRETHVHLANVTFLKPEIERIKQLSSRLDGGNLLVRIRARNDQDFVVNTSYLFAGDFVRKERQLLACDCAVQRVGSITSSAAAASASSTSNSASKSSSSSSTSSSSSSSPSSSANITRSTVEQRLAVAKRWVTSCLQGCNVAVVTGPESERRYRQANSMGNWCKWDPDVHGHQCYKELAVCLRSDRTEVASASASASTSAPAPASASASTPAPTSISTRCTWAVIDTRYRVRNITATTQYMRNLAGHNDRLCREQSARA